MGAGETRDEINEARPRKSVWLVALIFIALVINVIMIFIVIQHLSRLRIEPIKSWNQSSDQSKEPAFHGREPSCPEKYCISVAMNGDLLFHPALWNHFKNAEKGFDFTELFAAQGAYYAKTDLAICDFETPIAPPSGPFTGYPIFSIPPQVADAAAAIGYQACTTDTNHSFDGGTAGINRLIDKLDELGIAHTGTYKTESESLEPLIIEVEGGKIALIGGTVSLNGLVPEHDWQVDRMRDGAMRQHDIDRAVAKATKARQLGADIVLMQLHSVTEYITYADPWHQSVAHQLADTGLFDLIYFHGSHSVQPIENYNGLYIIYGVGNSVTVSADNNPTPLVNNEGLTVRAQFSSRDSENWRLNKLSYLPTFNKTGSRYAWCPLAPDHPEGFCASPTEDAARFQRMKNILHSMGVPESDPVLKPWLITEEDNLWWD